MKKFEGKIHFKGERIGYGCLSLLIALIITIILSGFGDMFPNSLVHVLYIIGDNPIIIAIIILAFFGIGYLSSHSKAVKTVRFEIDEENDSLVVFVNSNEIFNERDFTSRGLIHAVNARYSNEMLFLLEIKNVYGVGLSYYERIGVNKSLQDVTISSVRVNPGFIPKALDPHPSFIWETYQALKEYESKKHEKELMKEVNEFSPFASTTIKSYSREEEKNKARWNETTEINSESDFYNLEAFKSNKDCLALDKIEKSAFGDVTGKSLLHLQCHFGMSTLSFARMGANVTGVDFSDKAIDLAQSLSEELSIPANFVRSNIYDLRENLSEKFDYVFTSYGVLTWLKDIPEWARIVAHFLKPGGIFFISEFHPFAGIFDDETEKLQIRYPYFPNEKPMRFDSEFSYADDTKLKNTEVYEWTHSLEEILDSLLKAGLQIQEYREYSHARYQMFPFMKRVKRGEYRIENDPIPLMFSVKATKV